MIFMSRMFRVHMYCGKKKTVCGDVEGWKLLASTGVQVGPS